MARKTPLFNNGIFHVYNRGVDKRDIFMDESNLKRFATTISYYRVERKIRLSLSEEITRNDALTKASNELSSETGLERPPIVEIINYCLMPNHFHLTLKQVAGAGISDFMHQIGTSYTNFFNLKYQRAGALFQGTFKAVLVETEEQLIHLSRYIHINPLRLSYPNRTKETLLGYKWSSYLDYLGRIENGFCQKDVVLGSFKNPKSYEEFVLAEIQEREIEKLGQINIDDDFSWFNSS